MEAVGRVLSEVHDFLRSFEKRGLGQPRFYFRGENECYPTVKSGLRRALDIIVDENPYGVSFDGFGDDYIDNYLTYSENFIYFRAKYFIESSDAPLLTTKNGIPTDESLRDLDDFNSILSEVQQRVGGTNFIDFSSDINTALFFATADIDLAKGDSRIIVYADSSNIDSNGDLLIKSPEVGFSDKQSSWFIRPKNQGELDILDEDRFKVINIPADDKIMISWWYLRAYSNIKTNTLFNGIEGFLRANVLTSYIAPPILQVRAGTDIKVGDYITAGKGGRAFPYDGKSVGHYINSRSLSESSYDELFDAVLLQG